MTRTTPGSDAPSGRPTVVTVAAGLMLLQVAVGLTGAAVTVATADSWFGPTLVTGPDLSSEEARAAFLAVLDVAFRGMQVAIGLSAVANATVWGVAAWATADGQAWPRAVATILAALAASSAVTLPLVVMVSGSAAGFAAPMPQYSPWTFVTAGVTGVVTIAAAALLWARPARAFVEDARLRR
ncbi:hypothetical protein [Solicola sp. PLA-1-18]|uniref:hypothetical protein n=1 Tax=Solicola sp. PLA-1-18 TaxID=3380532 RepID=UPI003B7D2417